ncbi:unnamed protein product [Heterotrigona itama]|uniref:Uncharacterized protein n=1 Tax=Heterotrigona itama TaxID=395501 RepID=A0A6V7HIP3_9HYME|nr:unnamed protein product [Heterotrigona itama]
MERCKHAPQEQAGFARLTDEALGTVMAPFPRRKQNETATEKANKRSRDRDKDRALTGNGGAAAGGETRTEIFLQIITFNLLVPFIKTNASVHWRTFARQSNAQHSGTGGRRVCDDNGERRGEAQWFQLASPRGATTTTTISAEHRHRQHQHRGDSVFV